MLFKVFAAASFLATFAAGYVIPAEALSSRSLGVTDNGVDDLFVRTQGSHCPCRIMASCSSVSFPPP